MGLGLGISVDWASLVPYYAKVASAFAARVKADGGTVENTACLKKDLKVLNPTPPPAFTGLLNTYSGAAAAYSLRLLDNTYSGNAVKVRRSSDNAEQDIAFVNNELDTASLETFAGSGNAFVTTWYDQSGNGNDATQTTASKQPKIVSSGSTILENGKAAVEFDGSDDYLENSTIFNEPIISMFSVHSNTSTSSPRRPFGLRGDTGISRSTFAQDSDNTLRYDGAFTSGTLTAAISQKVRYSQRETSRAYDYINGVENINNVEALPNIIAQPSIGAVIASLSSLYVGKFQEGVIWINDELSNRTGIETNINDFYSIY